MSDPIDEAVGALRDDSPPEDGEATLARVLRTLAADAPSVALADVPGEAADRLLETAAAALRGETTADGGDATLARILRTLAEPDASSLAASEVPDEPLGDDLLHVAAAALRDETAAEVSGDATLARIREHVAADRVDRAADAVAREAVRPGAAEGTQRRVLATLAARRTRARWAVAAAAVLVAMIGAPTTWALSTGRLQRWLTADDEPATHLEPARHVEPSIPVATPAPPRLAPAEPTFEPAPEPTPEPTPEPRVATVSLHDAADDERSVARGPVRSSVRRTARPLSQSVPAPVEEPLEISADARERALFEAAHRLHFGGGASERTLAAWDAYLAAHPAGRYAPEARYNRALTLVRLDRRADARRALSAFASAPRGSYRREEARALIDALDAASE